MELREFAEQVLFSTNLAEKLRPPGELTDDHPGPAVATPPEPGRPLELRFKPPGTASADFPGLHRLEREHERGRLLHFFANHELLATELMALVLLRFPEAPAAFRRGVLQTLKDEQDHTRFYLERMAACGVGFGDLPLSGYFWRSVAPMENPIDYVAGLSLTFEQANLDYCRHFARGFATVGDTPTATLLERIYRDEIAHVAYGLKWFRRWKNPNDSDWEAFCRQLRFPLSPQRAKGFTVNVEGRRAAGLDPDFIAHLDVYSHSKGRTPTVWLFNPFAEGHLAEGRAFQPTALQTQLARDLENLPQFLGRPDDLVLVSRRPAIPFLATLKQAGFPLPEYVEIAEHPAPTPNLAAASSAALLHDRKLGQLRPWAWSPDSLERLRPLFPQVTGDRRTPEQCLSPALAELYSKTWSCRFLHDQLPGLAAAIPTTTPAEWLCPETALGTVAASLDEALRAIDAIRRRGHHRVVVKQALGLAGQGALRLWEPEVLDAQRRWIASTVARGRSVVVEPWLERVVDFSLQFEMEPDGLHLRGWTGLVNDQRGQFVANWAEPDFARRPPVEVAAALTIAGGSASALIRLYRELADRLAPLLRERGFRGPLGLDAFVYRDADGRHRLKPVVEINPRHTMGRLTLELMRHTCPGSFGLFRLVNPPALRAAGDADFAACARRLADRHPIVLEGEPVPRLRTGVVCLNDPAQARVALAIFHVDRSHAALS
jgi:uncharacterized ferritin-like protein (DUF455 family)